MLQFHHPMLIFWLQLIEGKDGKLERKKRKSATEDFP